MPSARTLGRMNVLAPFRDEVLQRVRVKLLVGTRGEGPRLVHYRGRGDLSTWVTVVVVREALTMMRAAGRDRVDDAELLLLEATSAGPELATIHAEHRAALVQALRSAIDDLMPEQRNLLRLHHLHGASIDRIGAMLGLHRSSAARRLEKIRRLLLDRTRQRLSEMLRVDPNELDAIMGRVDSKLDLSLERLLL
jgi:RNA polymerase sigma-70 factor (ECF subfamily)